MITIAPELRELPHYQLADLLELQGELKDLTERNAAKLRRSITKHGLFVPFFVWPAPDGNTYILDGHQRKRTLVKDGHGALPVPCVLVHADTLPEAKEKLLVISSQYGRITQEGFDEFTFDLPDVGELVHFDALAFDFGQDEDEEPEQGDAEPQIDRAAELQEKWQTERGQLWAIGEHRLLVGDSTVRADVERVMGGERADITFTSPPYNLGDNVALSTRKKKNNAYLEYDDINGDYLGLLRCFTELALLFSGYVLVNVQFLAGNKVDLINYLYAFKDRFADVAVWTKSNPQPAMAENVMDSAFECILFFSSEAMPTRAIKTGKFRGLVSNVLPGTVNSENVIPDLHSATFPVYLPEYFTRHFSAAGSIVYEPFCGSGTTLVACQNLNRRGRAIEISPAYCAVILQRMADAFPGIEIHQLP